MLTNSHSSLAGLKAMKRIMGTGKYQIRVDIIDHNNVNHTRIYPSFDLGPSDGYRLTVDGYNDGGKSTNGKKKKKHLQIRAWLL